MVMAGHNKDKTGKAEAGNALLIFNLTTSQVS